MPKNRAKARVPAAAPKTAKAEPPRVSSQRETPFFCFRYADRATRNEWKFSPGAADAPGLFDFICEMGRLSWSEIESHRTGVVSRHKKHHAMPVAQIDPPARADIARLKLDEIFGDDIFRFRVSGPKRLWGFREDRVFHVIWWDPHHKVYESDPA
jgi:hypothetical protein